MIDTNLAHHLQSLRENYTAQLEQLENDTLDLEKELERIATALRSLEIERNTAQQRLYQTKEVLHNLTADEQEAALDTIFQTYQVCQKALLDALSQVRDSRADLQRQIDSLIQQDPALETALLEYHEFETTRQKALEAVPSFYRHKLEAAHQKLQERLADLLTLENRLRDLPDLDSIYLPIVQALNGQHGQVFWVLPAVAQTNGREDLFTRRMNALENTLLRALASLAGERDTLLTDLERCSWAGYRGLTTLADESDNIALAEAVQQHLAQTLPEIWPFPDLAVQPQVVALDWDLWLLGINRSGAFEPVQVEVEVETALPAAGALFNERDVAAWERPLRVTEASSWTLTARRLRTLLTRLVAQGRVGCNSLPIESIWAGLPLAHADNLRQVLPILTDQGVLITEAENGNQIVHVNPERLGDVQDLINREITPFWAPVVQEDRETR